MDAARTNAWTVLIYTSASRDLEKAVADSLEEITQQGGPPVDVRVVAQMGAQGSSQRYQLHGVSQPQALEPSRPGDMSDPEELRRFLLWGMEKYPSQQYAIVLGGHGAGFAGAVTDAQRRHMISLPELERALGELPQKPELVIFNTCLMAQAEVASQLQATGTTLVASQSELHGLGLPLAAWLQSLPDQPDGPAAAAQLIQAAARVPERAPAVASIDLRRWPELSQALDQLAGAILDSPESSPRLRRHISEQPELWPHPQDRPLVDQIDVAGLCARWSQDEALPALLRQQAGQVRTLVLNICRSSSPEAHGLSIYAPEKALGGPVKDIYAALSFARETRWDEAFNGLVKER